jgi:hypothetical protein
MKFTIVAQGKPDASGDLTEVHGVFNSVMQAQEWADWNLNDKTIYSIYPIHPAALNPEIKPEPTPDHTLKFAITQVIMFLRDHSQEVDGRTEKLQYQFMISELYDLYEWITDDTVAYYESAKRMELWCPECGNVVCAVTCRNAS